MLTSNRLHVRQHLSRFDSKQHSRENLMSQDGSSIQAERKTNILYNLEWINGPYRKPKKKSDNNDAMITQGIQLKLFFTGNNT